MLLLGHPGQTTLVRVFFDMGGPYGIRLATPPSMAKKAAKKTATKRKTAARRELIDTGSDKRYVRRATAGKFKESDDVGKAAASDRRTDAKTRVKSGQGDRGDR
jgi:hypothetical protein